MEAQNNDESAHCATAREKPARVHRKQRRLGLAVFQHVGNERGVAVDPAPICSSGVLR
ncbi:MAG: hypothetical protein NVV73_01150 [Cellvibrionaceae bacterium]|nr:hypothetical protein [Cellvibrionaceae bacterium]